MRQHPIGTGPFEFVEFKPNESIKVARNPDYWKKDRPYLDGIEFTIIRNMSTAALAFISGSFDMTFPYTLTVTRLPPLPLRGCCEEGILTQCLDKPARINVGIACSWSTIANRPGIRRVQITRPRCANGRDNTTFATIYARRRPARRRVQAAR
jgi:hypothetical protein